MCYGMTDCCVTYWREGCWVKEQEVEKGIDDLLEKKDYTDLNSSNNNNSQVTAGLCTCVAFGTSYVRANISETTGDMGLFIIGSL